MDSAEFNVQVHINLRKSTRPAFPKRLHGTISEDVWESRVKTIADISSRYHHPRVNRCFRIAFCLLVVKHAIVFFFRPAIYTRNLTVMTAFMWVVVDTTYLAVYFFILLRRYLAIRKIDRLNKAWQAEDAALLQVSWKWKIVLPFGYQNSIKITLTRPVEANIGGNSEKSTSPDNAIIDPATDKEWLVIPLPMNCLLESTVFPNELEGIIGAEVFAERLDRLSLGAAHYFRPKLQRLLLLSTIMLFVYVGVLTDINLRSSASAIVVAISQASGRIFWFSLFGTLASSILIMVWRAKNKNSPTRICRAWESKDKMSCGSCGSCGSSMAKSVPKWLLVLPLYFGSPRVELILHESKVGLDPKAFDEPSKISAEV